MYNRAHVETLDRAEEERNLNKHKHHLAMAKREKGAKNYIFFRLKSAEQKGRKGTNVSFPLKLQMVPVCTIPRPCSLALSIIWSHVEFFEKNPRDAQNAPGWGASARRF
jgi:hypothetical protein